MEITRITEAAVFVGEWSKYNNGSREGEFLDLCDYSTKEEFYEACKKVHNDIDDPEFMFPDWENLPNEFISEGWISENIFPLIEAMQELNEDEEEAFCIWVNNGHWDCTKEDANDLIKKFNNEYKGKYNDDEDFAYYFVEEVENLPEWVKNYFDYEQYAKELLMGDFWGDAGYYFYRV